MESHSGWKRIGTAAAAAALLAAPPAGAQTSPTCQSALAALIGLRISIEQEKAERNRCLRNGRTACTAEEGRIRALEQQRLLVLNYLERYCSR